MLLILPHGVAKESTASVYGLFDRAAGFGARRASRLLAWVHRRC